MNNVQTTDICPNCGHARYWHKKSQCTIESGCGCKEFVEKKDKTPENFDDGITHVAPKGEFKPTNEIIKYCEDCGHRKNIHDKEGCSHYFNQYTRCKCRNLFEVKEE